MWLSDGLLVYPRRRWGAARTALDMGVSRLMLDFSIVLFKDPFGSHVQMSSSG